MKSSTKTRRRPEDSFGKLRQRALLIQCTDCKMVIGTEKGRTPEVEVSWSLCLRCMAKRNGLFSAKNFCELGIY